MNLNRYKIKNGKYVFHTFEQGQKFNTSVWLENDGRFEKKTDNIVDESGNKTLVDVGYYKYYNQDGTADLVKEQQVKLEEDKAKQISEAKQYLADTDFYMTVDKYETLTIERQEELKAKRAEARVLINSLEG